MAVLDRLFDEAYYLQANPDVGAAVQAGQFPSGLAHFLSSGVQEGRTNISRFYRNYSLTGTGTVGNIEARYLEANPDVAAVVAAGGLASGLQHYLSNGEREGRSLFVDGLDEAWYRRRYPDVDQAIAQGAFTSGLEHYLAFGRAEQRSTSPLFELDYFDIYPDIRTARDSGGIYLSAADHFSALGQVEGRVATFSGTDGNDTVVGSAAMDTLTGVQMDVGPCFVGGTLVGGECREYDSFGVNEQDVLIGGPGVDTFELGRSGVGRSFAFFRSFYQGNGDGDFARIENFEPGRDRLVVAGRNGPADVRAPGTEFEATPDGVRVYSINGASTGLPPGRDLMALVSGIANPTDVLNSTTFLGPPVF